MLRSIMITTLRRTHAPSLFATAPCFKGYLKYQSLEKGGGDHTEEGHIRIIFSMQLCEVLASRSNYDILYELLIYQNYIMYLLF
jgi:hypothetical protein